MNTKRNFVFFKVFLVAFLVLFSEQGFSSLKENDSDVRLYAVRVEARDKYDRSRITDAGLDLEIIMSDSVYIFATESEFKKIQKLDLRILEKYRLRNRFTGLDFPPGDSRFHNYERMTKAIHELELRYPKIVRKFSIGKSIDSRELWAIQINSSRGTFRIQPVPGGGSRSSAKPGILFIGNHHAREHVSAEVPLMLVEFLAKNYGVDREITSLIDQRDIYIIPMLNPDGVEHDIATGSYRWQRKNMRKNGTSKPGVDLNRNYSFMWGTGGSSNDPASEVYMGSKPFSEPETQAIRDFVDARPNIKILLSYHTFSELILYPWGHKYQEVENPDDLKVYKAMSSRMATWNGYTPQQSSQLYIASGDTTDWAYGTRRIFSFTFELSPKDMWGGGFYPGASILDRVFEANLKPALYLIEMADDPYRAIRTDFDFRTAWLN